MREGIWSNEKLTILMIPYSSFFKNISNKTENPTW